MTETAIPPYPNVRMMRRATYASVVVAIFLVAIKLGAYLVTGSMAMLSTLIDSAFDVAASLINLVAVRTSLTPADQEHRFGHYKAEPLAGLGQATFVMGSALFLAVEASRSLWAPRVVESSMVGVGVMGVSIILTFTLVAYQRYVVRQTGSLAISADSLHYWGDVLVNLGVIAALLLTTQSGWSQADPLFALIIAAYILRSAWKIAGNALDQLMDRELSEKDRVYISELALSHPSVMGFHDLRTRAAGQWVFIQLHLGLKGHLSLQQAHQIAKEVEAKILQEFPHAEVIIHQDPVSEQDTQS